MEVKRYDIPVKIFVFYLFKLLHELQKVYYKSNLDLNNLESLFGTIEMAQTIKKLGDISPRRIAEYRKAIIKLIVRTLEKRIIYPVHRFDIDPPHCYKRLLDLIKIVGFDKSALITFNYDIALDITVLRSSLCIDYGFNNPDNSLKVLKFPELILSKTGSS